MRFIILCLLLPCIGLAQQTLNAEAFFLLGQNTDPNAETTYGDDVKFPWVRQYDLRTETRDFDFDKQEYTFRVSPSTAKIRKAQKALYEELRNIPNFDEQEVYCDQILTQNLDWLTLHAVQESKNVFEKLSIILSDKQTIYERMASTYQFDPQKLLKLETEKTGLEIINNKLDLEKNFLFEKYNIPSQQLDFQNFISVETISNNIQNMELTSQNKFDDVDLETAYKKQMLLKEIELESSEKKQLVDFVQVKYNGPHDDILNERISLGLGFQFNNSGNKKLKIQELKIEMDELNQKSQRLLKEKQDNLDLLKTELKNNIQSYYHFQKVMKEERESLQEISQKMAQKEGISPLFLLEIEERHLSMQIKSLDKKEDLIKDYLRYVHLSGQMCDSEFSNFLTL